MIIDGRAIAGKIYKSLMGQLGGKKVAFIIFKDDPASKMFVEVKNKAAVKLGIVAETFSYSVSNTEEAIEKVKNISLQGFDGVVIQLPLPEDIDADVLFNTLPSELDIDVLGKKAKDDYVSKRSNRVPPVAGAVEEIFKTHKVDLKYKEVFVLGRGRLVGEPVSMMLERNNITFISADIDTPKDLLEEELKSADIIISGIGKPQFIKPEMIKQGCILIDAGTSEQAGKLAGDADPTCVEAASLFTPVPGGVGPITVAVLFKNLL